VLLQSVSQSKCATMIKLSMQANSPAYKYMHHYLGNRMTTDISRAATIL